MYIMGAASGEPTAADDKYLKEYDPNRRGTDALGNELICHMVVTDDKYEAMQFTNLVEFQKVWAQKSTRWPHLNNRVNRPLSAYTVMPQEL